MFLELYTESVFSDLSLLSLYDSTVQRHTESIFIDSLHLSIVSFEQISNNQPVYISMQLLHDFQLFING